MSTLNKSVVLREMKDASFKRPEEMMCSINGNQELCWDLVHALMDGGRGETIRECAADTARLTREFMLEQKRLHSVAADTEEKALDVDAILGVSSSNAGIACKSCGVKDVRFHLVQDRSADEGSTAVCKCRSCGHQFRMRV